MTVQPISDRFSSGLALPEVLDICEAAPLAAGLLAARGNQMVIDASRVEKVGAQCMQVLLSAHATWLRDGAPFNISNPSRGFVDGLEMLGIPVSFFSMQEDSK